MEGKEAMVFHGNKWGWRAIAARLLLTPVLAAGVAVPAFAQTAPSSTPTMRSAPARSGEPKELLKMGRAALKAGQFDRAQDLARQADAANPTGRWGLFDDTPESLEKDISSARAKANRAEAEKLIQAAQTLMAKRARTPGEKMANLDQAYHMADRAVALYGPSNFLDGLNVFSSDRPDEIRKAIDAARIQLRKTAPASALAKAPAAPRTGAPRPGSSFHNPPTSGVRQVNDSRNATEPASASPAAALPPPKIPTSPADAQSAAARTQALKLIAEGRALLRQGQPLDARAKATEALKLNASFDPIEDAPEALLRDATAAAQARVNALVRESEAYQARQDMARADASLHNATVIASGFGFPTKALEEKLASLRAADPTLSPMTTAPAAVASKPAAVVPEVEVPAVVSPPRPVASVKPPVVTVVQPKETAAAPAKPLVGPDGLPGLVPPPRPAGLSGADMLARAELELKRGDLEMARKLAVQAHNADPSAKEDAQAMLRSIEAARALREQNACTTALKNAVDLCLNHQHDQALGVLRLLDPAAMTPEQKAEHAKLMALCDAELAKLKAPVTTVAAKDPPKPPTVAEQARALTEVEFQKLRSDGLETEAKARDAFNRGETDVAIQMLTDFSTRVKASSLTTARQGLLLGPVERRLESFRIMKRQIDFYTKEAREKNEVRELVAGRSLAEQQKREEIGKKVREVNDLVKAHKYGEAERLALQIKSLDPDDPALTAIYEMAKRQKRLDDAQKLKSDKEALVFQGLNDGEKMGPYADIDNPLVHNTEHHLRIMQRSGTDDVYIRTRSKAEREIELRLEQPLSIEFSQTPVREAITKLRQETGLNISIDDASIAEEALPLDTVTITDTLRDLSLRNVLSIILEKARLKFVIKNDVISITTEKKAKGQLVTKVFSVMDLVTPIPDFALAPHMTFAAAAARAGGAPAGIPGTGAPPIQTPPSGLHGGQPVGGSSPVLATGGPQAPGFTTSGSGTLDNRTSPLATSAHLAPIGRQNASAHLIRLITGMVRPYSWQELNGPGKIDYYDIGGALVVNQTADVIREVQDLLESLRRLQETSVAVEIRVISLSEAFFERVGVDFQMNVSTLSNDRKGFERALTTGMFRPEPFINSIDGVGDGIAVGWNPSQGGFTPDLNVPIRPNTFGLGIPPFGGYNGPGNGGLSLGMAFLNDIQVYMFLEAAQGDRRINIMQAPKVTLFNGQTSTVFVSDVAFFTLGLQVFNVGGQTIYQPISTPVPIGNIPNPNAAAGGLGGPGVSVTVQAIVSADRRFVRLNLAPTLTSLTSAVVPLFPVTAFITPVFEGGSQGVPIPFTQFFQQPSLSEISVQTTVAVPDGGTVVLGGLKTLAEGRNEFGPPVLSNIPYLNRLFRNQGIGRETRHIMIMVTPRIIIQSEEEFNQTQIQGPATPGIGGS